MSKRQAGILALFYFVVALCQFEGGRTEFLRPFRPAEASFIFPIPEGIRERNDSAEHEFLLAADDSLVNLIETEILVFKPRLIARRWIASAKNIVCDFNDRSLSIVGPLRKSSGTGLARIGEFQSGPEFVNDRWSLTAIPQDENRTHLSTFGRMKIRLFNKQEWPIGMKRGFRNLDSRFANPERKTQQQRLDDTDNSQQASKGRYTFLLFGLPAPTDARSFRSRY